MHGDTLTLVSLLFRNNKAPTLKNIKILNCKIVFYGTWIKRYIKENVDLHSANFLSLKQSKYILVSSNNESSQSMQTVFNFLCETVNFENKNVSSFHCKSRFMRLNCIEISITFSLTWNTLNFVKSFLKHCLSGN